MIKKNEITTEVSKVQSGEIVPAISQDEFLSVLRESMSVSALAVGKKFESDDLVRAQNVILRDVDTVDYNSAKDGDVHYAVWTVEVDGETGWYASGIVLTQLADEIISNNFVQALRDYGVKINAEWHKTRNDKRILRVTLL